MLKLLLSLVSVLLLPAVVRASYPNSHDSQILQIILNKNMLRDFEYEPTREGYRFSYQLEDGTTYTEVAQIHDALDDGVSGVETGSQSPAKDMSSKNRKLSPKSLQSLAG